MMHYLKLLLLNCLIVFFANHILPGVYVVDQTKLPHFGSDLIFSLCLGLLNSLIFPILRLIGQRNSIFRLAVFAIVLNFVAYAVTKFLPIGIHLGSLQGYFSVALTVTIGSFITNLWEMKHLRPKGGKPPSDPPIL